MPSIQERGLLATPARRRAHLGRLTAFDGAELVMLDDRLAEAAVREGFAVRPS